MGRRDEKGRVPVHAEAPRGGGTSLGDLLRKAGLLTQAGEATGPEPAVHGTAPLRPEAGPEARTDLSGCPKAVVRRERKGHGGRTVTRIEGLGLDEAALAELAREAARALGCGARVEGEAVAVQGEPGGRLEDWLREKGVRKVVRGN